jgi:ubiquinone/menaquinone biosynthesis C-methylase UbiE
MGWYARVLFPRLLDFFISASPLAHCRQTLLANVQGDVLEVGFGTGLNLQYYPPHIRHLTAVDINPGMQALARQRIRQSPICVHPRVLNGECLPMPDHAFDSVVSTWTLCSIANVARALCEIRRVLKPDGRFFFVEHGLSDNPRIQRWQHRLNPLQKRIADGCHLNRNIRELIEAQQFRMVELQQFYIEGYPKTLGYMYQGIAAPAGDS